MEVSKNVTTPDTLNSPQIKIQEQRCCELSEWQQRYGC